MYPKEWHVMLILLAQLVVLTEQNSDGIITASSHKSFYNLDTFVNHVDNKRSRNKRSVVFSEDEVETLLTMHQDYRRDVSPTASNMEYMTWDANLAEMAVEYSEKCIWGHGTVPNTSPYASYGQNLWIQGGTTQRPDPGTGVIAWHNEVNDYDYNSNTCKPGKQCGHYTQIVWSSSVAVGCGMAFCKTTENWNTQNSWLLTCHYGPAGNYVGSKPFISGSSCTQCESKIGQCYDNMCRLCSGHDEQCDCKQECDHCGNVTQSTCSCQCPNGFYGARCENECVDWHENCWKSPGWPGPQWCDKHEAIPKGCPKMCGLCVDPDPDFFCVPGVTHPTSSTTKEPHVHTSPEMRAETTTRRSFTDVRSLSTVLSSTDVQEIKTSFFTEQQEVAETLRSTESQRISERLRCSDCDSGAPSQHSAIIGQILSILVAFFISTHLLS